MDFQTFITPAELAAELNNPKLIIFDCSFFINNPEQAKQEYSIEHIAGAYFANLNLDLSSPETSKSGAHPLPERADIYNFFKSHGLNHDSQIVAYDKAGGSSAAARLWWLARYIGFRRVAVLQGGFQAWKSAGNHLSKAVLTPQPGNFELSPPINEALTLAEVKEKLAHDSIVLVDSRTYERYSGASEPIYSKAGHIPGALNLPFPDNIDAAGNLKSKAEVAKNFTKLVPTGTAADTVFYCGSGVTACFNLLALEHVGISGAGLYAGSWSEWIKHEK